MDEISRRQFVCGLGGFALLPFAAKEPDLILYNGQFWTVDDYKPRAQAVAIAGGRFTAVGSNDDVLALAAGNAKKIDLGMKSVMPGFIDAHAHPAGSGVSHLRMAACDLPTIAEVLSTLKQRASKTASGEWVLGFLYDDSKTEHPLTRHDLDAAIPDHPVLVHHRGGHTGFANSLAFKAAGVTEKTPDPPGGKFDHDASGRLDGRVADAALETLEKAVHVPEDPEAGREGVALISRMMTSKGVSSAADADASLGNLQAYRDARDAGELRMRVYSMMNVGALDRLISQEVCTGTGDEWVRVGAVKQFADGSISERTARLSQPYIGMPGYFGLFLSSEEELYEHGRKAHAAGWQLATHANGDVAIDRTLRVYERIQQELPRKDPRYRIEHCTLISDSLVQRMKALGAVPVPFSCYVYFHGEKMHFYGQDRLQHMFAMRSFLDVGLRPADSSDYTASPFDPMMWLQSQITRTDSQGQVWGANQRISLEQAIRCGTINGAYASFEERLKGSITAGKLADLVVLGRDPFREDPGSLSKIPVERTMVGGHWVYES